MFHFIKIQIFLLTTLISSHAFSKTVVVSGAKSSILRNDIKADIVKSGSGKLTILGRIDGDVTISGSGEVVIEGDIEGDIRKSGSGVAHIKSQVRGKIKASGTGTIFLSDRFNYQTSVSASVSIHRINFNTNQVSSSNASITDNGQLLELSASLNSVRNNRYYEDLNQDEALTLLTYTNNILRQCKISLDLSNFKQSSKVIDVNTIKNSGAASAFEVIANSDVQGYSNRINIHVSPKEKLYFNLYRGYEITSGVSSHLGDKKVHRVSYPQVVVFGSGNHSTGVILAHELGHLFGLEHVSASNNIMSRDYGATIFERYQCKSMRKTILKKYQNTLMFNN